MSWLKNILDEASARSEIGLLVDELTLAQKLDLVVQLNDMVDDTQRQRIAEAGAARLRAADRSVGR